MTQIESLFSGMMVAATLLVGCVDSDDAKPIEGTVEAVCGPAPVQPAMQWTMTADESQICLSVDASWNTPDESASLPDFLHDVHVWNECAATLKVQ